MPFFFQGLDEGGLGVAGGRLGELLLALELHQAQHLPLLQGRQGGLLFLFVLHRFLVQGGEAVEGDGEAAGLEPVVRRADGDRDGVPSGSRPSGWP